jgi:hypothetical protein
MSEIRCHVNNPDTRGNTTPGVGGLAGGLPPDPGRTGGGTGTTKYAAKSSLDPGRVQVVENAKVTLNSTTNYGGAWRSLRLGISCDWSHVERLGAADGDDVLAALPCKDRRLRFRWIGVVRPARGRSPARLYLPQRGRRT